MSRPAVPRSAEVQRDAAEIATLSREVVDAWRWAAPDAYRRPSHAEPTDASTPASTVRCAACAGSGERDNGPCPDCGGDGSLPSGGDPTGSTVVSTQRYRSLLRDAASDVREAKWRLAHAVQALGDALRLQEPREGIEVADVRTLPHPADRGDLARAHAAQERRRQRAESSGDWTEVTG
ncbi:MAG TPA: hypothetical protein VF288_10705 [Mycobacteriales bacterium]